MEPHDYQKGRYPHASRAIDVLVVVVIALVLFGGCSALLSHEVHRGDDSGRDDVPAVSCGAYSDC